MAAHADEPGDSLQDTAAPPQAPAPAPSPTARPLTHPGLLHTEADLKRWPAG